MWRQYTPGGCSEVHTIPADVELFATFTIPQVEEADLRLCRGRPGVVCGVVLRYKCNIRVRHFSTGNTLLSRCFDNTVLFVTSLYHPHLIMPRVKVGEDETGRHSFPAFCFEQ